YEHPNDPKLILETMSNPTTGIWFIGALGGISTTVSVGLASLSKKLSDQAGLVSALPRFERLGLADWSAFTIGGHGRNIRPGTLINVGKTIESLASGASLKKQGEKPAAAIERIAADLAEFKKNQKLEHVIVV